MSNDEGKRINSNIKSLTKWYFVAAKELSIEDIEAAHIMTGLPIDFLEKIRDATITELDEISSSMTVIPFIPRVTGKLLMRLLDSPSEVNDSIIVSGLTKSGVKNG